MKENLTKEKDFSDGKNVLDELKKEALGDSNEKIFNNHEEEIGFHKGALSTLVNERNELIKMASNVEKVMSYHVSRLKELGVKFSEK